MIKLVKVPEWVYMNCIYDKKIGSKLTEILRNISEWESSGKIRYQFDIGENIDITIPGRDEGFFSKIFSFLRRK